MDQLGKVDNPARGQLNRKINIPCPRSRLRIWSCETGSAVRSRVSLLISILRLNRVPVTPFKMNKLRFNFFGANFFFICKKTLDRLKRPLEGFCFRFEFLKVQF